MQVILCMESSSDSKSDYIYISSAIRKYYSIDRNKIKFTRVYMDGRGNYASSKVSKKIASFTAQYKAGNKNAESVVIYCFDCDRYDAVKEDEDFLKKAKQYCKEKGYKFVWFCRDIENVFLGRQVADSQKTKEAENFAKANGVEKLDKAKLCADKYKDGYSNLCIVLDDYLGDNTENNKNKEESKG